MGSIADAEQQEFGRALDRVLSEVRGAVQATSVEQLQSLAEEIDAAQRIFVLGSGRSGLAMKMLAMRLMHLGHIVHVVAETTTPAIGAGDLLLAATGSGSTAGVVASAGKAKEAGARVAVLTAAADSPIGEIADQEVRIPAARKTDHSGAVSVQYAGSLFEQSVVLLCDGLFQRLWERSGKTGEQLWPMHANLE